jgi:hypothetical protein
MSTCNGLQVLQDSQSFWSSFVCAV